MGIRPLHVRTADKQWVFIDGGECVRECSSSATYRLKHPLIIIRGRFYIDATESTWLFGYQMADDCGDKIVVDGKTIRLDVANANSPYNIHQVEGLDTAHVALATTATLCVRRSLHGDGDNEKLPASTNLLVRRKCVVDGVASLVVTRTGNPLTSYLVDEQQLWMVTREQTLDGSDYARHKTWFQSAAQSRSGLRHGRRETLFESACLSMDFCWSMRCFERPLLELIRRRASGSEVPVHVVMFMSGRWMRQQPEEMHTLIELGKDPSIVVTWGLHSWSHPKYGRFMNVFSSTELKEDTLRLEKTMLEWGIIPTIFYRFPGLIHDQPRLCYMLDMDLFSIDCDSWQAMIVDGEDNPFAQPIRAGSIVLVHGNGNEPRGILVLRDWLEKHPQWRLADLAEFLSTDQPG